LFYQRQYTIASNPPIITAASDDHYNELIESISTAYLYFPKTEIIVYDLGLSDTNRQAIKSLHNIQLRQFPFSSYPHYIHILSQYRWKTLVTAVSLIEHPNGFWWCDSSVRWTSNDLTRVYQQVHDRVVSPLVLMVNTYHSVFGTTHPDMYAYLSTNVTRLQHTVEYGATMMFIINTPLTVEIIKWFDYLQCDNQQIHTQVGTVCT
jgi:hypothetical protein